MSTDLRRSGSTTDSDESRLNPLAMSTYSTRNNSMSNSLFSNNIMTRSLPTIEGSLNSLAIRKLFGFEL